MNVSPLMSPSLLARASRLLLAAAVGLLPCGLLLLASFTAPPPAFGQEGELSDDELEKQEDDSIPVLRLELDQAILVVGESARAKLFGHHPDETVEELTAYATFLSIDEDILTVDAAGLVVATGPGTGLVFAQYEGHGVEATLIVVDPADQDGDGIADAIEVLHGLDPDDPADAGGDLDGDGLANRDELDLGTDPQVADSDGDFLNDGDEVAQGRNPSGPDPFELGAGCMVSALNRTALVPPGGGWVLPNIPANQGLVRVRATCIEGGRTRSGQSGFISVPANGQVRVDQIDFETASPVPNRLELAAPTVLLTAPGQTVVLTATAVLADGTTQDVTAPEKGTDYRSSNPAIAAVDAQGVVTANVSGTVLVSALNQGTLAVLQISVIAAADSDGDGLPDDLEIANGLDPNDPIDGLDDSDGDGLATADELARGLDPLDADSDDDQLADGREVGPVGTNPLLFDSDGDLVGDGLELVAGSNPLDRQSVDLAPILADLEVTPVAFTITYNTIVGEGSRRLKVEATLVDGTRLDATGAPYGASYRSSNLVVASFGSEPGQVFAGATGAALVTAEIGTFTAGAEVTVESFAPRALAFLPLPGAANDLALDGDYLYIASGGADLQVVDVTSPTQPALVASLSLPGEAFDVVVAEGIAYLAAGSAGLVTVDVANSAAPVYLGSIKTRGAALAVAVAGEVAYVADGRDLRLFAVDDPARPRALGSLQLSGRPRGVALQGSLALVAAESGGLQIVDVGDPQNPFLVGSTATRGCCISNAADVVVRENRAYVADGAANLGGIKVVDISDPAMPLVVGASTDAFGISSLALAGSFVLGADYYYPNAVPIWGVGTDAPRLAAVLDFSRAPSFRDDNGKGVVTRGELVYMVGDDVNLYRFALTGRSALHIGQFLRLEEIDGTPRPPTVQLSAPIAGATVRERRLLRITAQATDDVGVALVRFKVGGVPVATDFEKPFTFAYEVPDGFAELSITAEAEDFTGALGTSEAVLVTVTPDPDPVVSLLSPTGALPILGGTGVILAAHATDDEAISQVEFFVDGNSFAILDRRPYVANVYVEPSATSLTVTAVATDNVGQTAATEPAVFPVDPDDPPSVTPLDPADGGRVPAGGLVRFSVGASDDIELIEVRYLVDGEVAAAANTPPFEILLRVDPAATEMRLAAIARDSSGQETTSAEIVLIVEPDPGTTVSGRLVDLSGDPVAGAAVTCLGLSTAGGADGRFTIAAVPTVQRTVACQASGSSEGEAIAGVSLPQVTEPGGVTEIGDLVLAGSLLYLADGQAGSADHSGRVLLLDDPATGRVLPWSEELGETGISGLAFDARGRLWATALEEIGGAFTASVARVAPSSLAERSLFPGPGRTTLYSLDPDTGEVLAGDRLSRAAADPDPEPPDPGSVVTGPEVSAKDYSDLLVQDLTFDPVSETLFVVAGGWSGFEILAVDPEGSSARGIGDGLGSDFVGDSVGLAAGANGQLYLLLGAAEGPGSLLTVDPKTGERGEPLAVDLPAPVQGLTLAPGGRRLRLVTETALYELDPVTGQLTLLSTPQGHIEGNLQALAYRTAQSLPVLTTLAGRVVDGAGAAVADAEVLYPGGSLHSAEDGFFSAAGVLVKTQNVRVVAADFPDLVFSAAESPVAGGTTDLGEVVLTTRGCVEGFLIAGPSCIADGSALSLELEGAGEESSWIAVGSVQPGGDGSFCATVKQWLGYRLVGGAVCAENPALPCVAYIQLWDTETTYGRCASPDHVCQDYGTVELHCEDSNPGGGG